MAPFTSPQRDSPLWTTEQANVVFVLGGPGAGKGTQCSRLVGDYAFEHLSAGDLLRAEQARPGGHMSELISSCIRDGQIVPQEVTIQLLENAMGEAMKQRNKHRFLIDGFPRKMDQALRFEEIVVPSVFTLFFDCPEQILEERLINRGKTSGREDDNLESIRKRFKTFVDSSMPVVEYYEKQGRVVKVDGSRAPDAVYADVQSRLEERGLRPVAHHA